MLTNRLKKLTSQNIAKLESDGVFEDRAKLEQLFRLDKPKTFFNLDVNLRKQLQENKSKENIYKQIDMQRVVGRRRLTLSEAESPLINVSFNPPVTSTPRPVNEVAPPPARFRSTGSAPMELEVGGNKEHEAPAVENQMATLFDGDEIDETPSPVARQYKKSTAKLLLYLQRCDASNTNESIGEIEQVRVVDASKPSPHRTEERQPEQKVVEVDITESTDQRSKSQPPYTSKNALKSGALQRENDGTPPADESIVSAEVSSIFAKKLVQTKINFPKTKFAPNTKPGPADSKLQTVSEKIDSGNGRSAAMETIEDSQKENSEITPVTIQDSSEEPNIGSSRQISDVQNQEEPRASGDNNKDSGLAAEISEVAENEEDSEKEIFQKVTGKKRQSKRKATEDVEISDQPAVKRTVLKVPQNKTSSKRQTVKRSAPKDSIIPVKKVRTTEASPVVEAEDPTTEDPAESDDEQVRPYDPYFLYDPNERPDCLRKGLRIRRIAQPYWIHSGAEGLGCRYEQKSLKQLEEEVRIKKKMKEKHITERQLGFPAGSISNSMYKSRIKEILKERKKKAEKLV